MVYIVAEGEGLRAKSAELRVHSSWLIADSSLFYVLCSRFYDRFNFIGFSGKNNMLIHFFVASNIYE
jgi:hypothetical protein